VDVEGVAPESAASSLGFDGDMGYSLVRAIRRFILLQYTLDGRNTHHRNELDSDFPR
jgi:hypothetical protein